MVSLNEIEADSVVWVNSTGGPLILADYEVAKHWQGILGSAQTSPKLENDYERACAVATLTISPLAVGNDLVAVLGDEPSQTTMLSVHSCNLLLIRWIWADSPESVIKVIPAALASENWTRSGFQLVVSSGKVVLFDSSGPLSNEALVRTARVGNYSIETLDSEPDSRTRLVFHRLLRID